MVKEIFLVLSFFIATLTNAQKLNIDTATVKLSPIYHHGAKTDKFFTLYFWDIKEGQNQLLYPDGHKYLEGSYSIGKDSSRIRQGFFQYFYQNGSIKICGNYLNDKQKGLWKYYDSSEVCIYHIDHDSNIKTYFHENGNISALGKYKISKAGHESRYGKWIFYHKNGKLSCIGKLNWTGKVGKWNYYDISGQYLKTLIYKRQRLKKYKRINVNSDYRNICECK